MTPVGGGVIIRPEQAFADDNILLDEKGLVEKTKRPLYGFLYRFASSPAEADEWFQETLLVVFVSVPHMSCIQPIISSNNPTERIDFFLRGT